VSVLVVAQSSSEIPEGLMNNPVFISHDVQENLGQPTRGGTTAWVSGVLLTNPPR
jgi:hypothetical protein